MTSLLFAPNATGGRTKEKSQERNSTISLPAWATGAQTEEELQDWEEGYKNYRKQRVHSFASLRIRQSLRKERVRDIDEATTEIIDNEPMILGRHWFDSWITVATYYAVKGEFRKIKPPREWLAEKLCGSI